MSNSIGRRYQYGAGFIDQESGIRFEGHHPLERPDLWKRYLNEAEGIYRSHGFEGTLRRRELEEGTNVALFFLGLTPDGDAVAGVRFHGPLDSNHQAAIMEEMESSPEIDDIGALITREIPLGVLEVKGAWSKGETVTGHHLVTAISRAVTHAMNWLGGLRPSARGRPRHGGATSWQLRGSISRRALPHHRRIVATREKSRVKFTRESSGTATRSRAAFTRRGVVGLWPH